MTHDYMIRLEGKKSADVKRISKEQSTYKTNILCTF